jgi:hypothetical protein
MQGTERDSAGRYIDFLGYNFSTANMRLRKGLKKNFAKKVKVKSRKRRKEILAAYWGWCKYGKCKNLWNKITNDMSFADKGIKGSCITHDGKKFFDVPDAKLMDILNTNITILDFESDIHTKQGDGRYCVLFERAGQKQKFITNCFNLKDILDQARKAEKTGKKIFPVENVVIKRRQLSEGKSAYYFD